MEAVVSTQSTGTQRQAVICSLLESSDPYELIQHLIYQTSVPRSLNQLEQLFSNYGTNISSVGSNTIFHCARCHQLFDSTKRQEGECKIYHANSFIPSGSRYVTSCCSQLLKKDLSGPFNPFCFQGFHTSKPEKVDYASINSSTCEHNRCFMGQN
eukprot:TRINITY_DN5843_c0_g1_i1.p1 TRINITY_DN5843_c0_g1~~TRINITY_DN5843_c0_g1_i1.p1  ORF type:complete len:155 (-),score=26.50 TRINITY_DN5843_c0_g1_i1:89-553(-)